MFLAELFEAAKLVLVQILLASGGFKFSVIEGLYWIAPASVLTMLLTLLPFYEFPQMIESGDTGILMAYPLTFFAAALLGFGVNFAVFFVVQTTSALVLKALSVVRNIGIVIFSVMFLGETVSAREMCGYAISLGGFALFNYLKMNKLAERRKEYELVGGK